MVDTTLFCTKSGGLSGESPRVSPVAVPDQCSVQAVRALPETPERGGRSRVASGSVGAFTGLDLPKVTGYPGSAGPVLPPLRPGLPHTPIEACQELMLAIVAQGLADDDLAYVLSPTFIHHLLYVGLDPDTALNIKVKYLRREIDLKNLWPDLRQRG